MFMFMERIFGSCVYGVFTFYAHLYRFKEMYLANIGYIHIHR